MKVGRTEPLRFLSSRFRRCKLPTPLGRTNVTLQAEIDVQVAPLLPIEVSVTEVWLMEQRHDGRWHRCSAFSRAPVFRHVADRHLRYANSC